MTPSAKHFPHIAQNKDNYYIFPNVASDGCGSVEDVATSDATHIAYRARKPLGLFHCILCEVLRAVFKRKPVPMS